MADKCMTDEELYFFDTFGYLKVEQVVDKPTIEKAFEASQRVIKEHPELYQDSGYGDKYRGAFMFDKTSGTAAPKPADSGVRLCPVEQHAPPAWRPHDGERGQTLRP